ncbi:MAG: D-alanyl-D-alanine carboxypeptidase (penicillin-binding protein 5/6) [Gammaproteobacteria bacterium]|jgi:D-alanyl-D-alanine carboxypeptidase (penicillin-binding protein 5/6)
MKTFLFALFSVINLVINPLWAAGKPMPDVPSLEADSFYLVDFDSGRVLAEKNADKKVDPASITKLMTAYLVAKAIADGDISLGEMVTISEKAWRMKGSKMFVEVGKDVSVDALLKGMIIQSGNDASVALAEYIAGTESAFAGYMNHQAKQLGMVNTQFKNATGWPAEGHYSSAKDIALLSMAIIRDHPSIYNYYKEREYTFNGIRQYNRNKLLWRDETVDGLKTGHTEAAGYCLVTSAKRDGMRLISVVLGTKSDKARTRHSQSLLNYGFRFYETHKLYTVGEVLKTERVWYGDQKQVSMGVSKDIHITIPRGRYQSLNVAIDIDGELSAPIKSGQLLGKVTVELEGEQLASGDIVAIHAVNKGGLLDRLMDSVKLMFK